MSITETISVSRSRFDHFWCVLNFQAPQRVQFLGSDGIGQRYLHFGQVWMPRTPRIARITT